MEGIVKLGIAEGKSGDSVLSAVGGYLMVEIGVSVAIF
jgi:hypothetical protein